MTLFWDHCIVVNFWVVWCFVVFFFFLFRGVFFLKSNYGGLNLRNCSIQPFIKNMYRRDGIKSVYVYFKYMI